jgi:hypothetical protein
MSRLAEFRQLEKLIAQQTADLEAFKADPGLEREIEFETKLQALLGQYGKSLKDIRSILDPGASTAVKPGSAEPAKRTRRARVVKVYRNPLTGETVETKGGNNKLLGAWKAQFGHDEVESWVKQP